MEQSSQRLIFPLFQLIFGVQTNFRKHDFTIRTNILTVLEPQTNFVPLLHQSSLWLRQQQRAARRQVFERRLLGGALAAGGGAEDLCLAALVAGGTDFHHGLMSQKWKKPGKKEKREVVKSTILNVFLVWDFFLTHKKLSNFSQPQIGEERQTGLGWLLLGSPLHRCHGTDGLGAGLDASGGAAAQATLAELQLVSFWGTLDFCCQQNGERKKKRCWVWSLKNFIFKKLMLIEFFGFAQVARDGFHCTALGFLCRGLRGRHQCHAHDDPPQRARRGAVYRLDAGLCGGADGRSHLGHQRSCWDFKKLVEANLDCSSWIVKVLHLNHLGYQLWSQEWVIR